MEEKINTFQADGRHEARSHVKSKKTLTYGVTYELT